MRISDWSSDVCSSDLTTAVSSKRAMVWLNAPALPGMLRWWIAGCRGPGRLLACRPEPAHWQYHEASTSRLRIYGHSQSSKPSSLPITPLLIADWPRVDVAGCGNVVAPVVGSRVTNIH